MPSIYTRNHDIQSKKKKSWSRHHFRRYGAGQRHSSRYDRQTYAPEAENVIPVIIHEATTSISTLSVDSDEYSSNHLLPKARGVLSQRMKGGCSISSLWRKGELHSGMNTEPDPKQKLMFMCTSVGSKSYCSGPSTRSIRDDYSSYRRRILPLNVQACSLDASSLDWSCDRTRASLSSNSLFSPSSDFDRKNDIHALLETRGSRFSTLVPRDSGYNFSSFLFRDSVSHFSTFLRRDSGFHVSTFLHRDTSSTCEDKRRISELTYRTIPPNKDKADKIPFETNPRPQEKPNLLSQSECITKYSDCDWGYFVDTFDDYDDTGTIFPKVIEPAPQRRKIF